MVKYIVFINNKADKVFEAKSDKDADEFVEENYNTKYEVDLYRLIQIMSWDADKN